MGDIVSEWNRSPVQECVRQIDEAHRTYDAIYEGLLRIPDMSTHMLDTLQVAQGRLLEEGSGLREAVRAVEIYENLLRSIAEMRENFLRVAAYYHEIQEKIRQAEERKRLRRIRLEEKLKESAVCTRPLLGASKKNCGGSLSIVETKITVDAICDSCKWRLETWPPELYTNLAGEYYADSEKLEGGRPRDFLLIHSIELSLKALSGRVCIHRTRKKGKTIHTTPIGV